MVYVAGGCKRLLEQIAEKYTPANCNQIIDNVNMCAYQAVKIYTSIAKLHAQCVLLHVTSSKKAQHNKLSTTSSAQQAQHNKLSSRCNLGSVFAAITSAGTSSEASGRFFGTLLRTIEPVLAVAAFTASPDEPMTELAISPMFAYFDVVI
eukprot:8925-Heterococcus_DN1.PRE.1